MLPKQCTESAVRAFYHSQVCLPSLSAPEAAKQAHTQIAAGVCMRIPDVRRFLTGLEPTLPLKTLDPQGNGGATENQSGTTDKTQENYSFEKVWILSSVAQGYL